MPPAARHAAERLYKERRARDELFGADSAGFGEPAWDMLLLLGSRDEAGAVWGDELLEATTAPLQTAARHLEWLISRELVQTGPLDPGHGRVPAKLSDRGCDLMLSYLNRLIPENMPICQ